MQWTQILCILGQIGALVLTSDELSLSFWAQMTEQSFVKIEENSDSRSGH